MAAEKLIRFHILPVLKIEYSRKYNKFHNFSTDKRKASICLCPKPLLRESTNYVTSQLKSHVHYFVCISNNEIMTFTFTSRNRTRSVRDCTHVKLTSGQNQFLETERQKSPPDVVSRICFGIELTLSSVQCTPLATGLKMLSNPPLDEALQSWRRPCDETDIDWILTSRGTVRSARLSRTQRPDHLAGS